MCSSDLIFERLDFEKINYSKAYYDLKATVMPTEDYEGIKVKLESNLPGSDIRYRYYNSGFHHYSEPVGIGKKMELGFSVFKNNEPVKISSQKFFFNKATGKKITLANEASKNYPGDGAFTLVNGVQNEKGFAKASEFLGFLGTDLDATIDLGKEMEISKITLHTLNLNGSWIYLPDWVDVSFLPDPDSNNKYRPVETFSRIIMDEDNVIVVELDKPKSGRYIRVVAKNIGIIPSGKPGAGNPAWLFVDEIEVQ